MSDITSWHSYPRIYNMGHAAIKELFLDDVLIEEKIDGSQFSFGRFDGELKCRSKSKQLVLDAPEKLFLKAIDTASGLDLKDGWTYRAEYLQKPKHNSLAYDRTPKDHLIIFDISPTEEEYLCYSEKQAEAERVGLEVVPIMFCGKVTNPGDLLDFLEKESVLGGQRIEGVVVKNYRRFGRDKKVLLGKHVSEAFKEKHNKQWKKGHPNSADITQILIGNYKIEARWQKAVQHLRDDGRLLGDVKDIGGLIKETQYDIEKECKQEIMEALFKYYFPQIKRACVGGLPEWYKNQLVEKQFA